MNFCWEVYFATHELFLISLNLKVSFYEYSVLCNISFIVFCHGVTPISSKWWFYSIKSWGHILTFSPLYMYLKNWMLMKGHLYFTPLLFTVSAFYYHLHCNSLLVDCKDKGSISLLGAYFYIHNFWFMMYLTGFFGQKIPLSIWDNSLRKKWLWGFFLLVAMYLQTHAYVSADPSFIVLMDPFWG